MPDFRLIHHGSVVTLQAVTDDAKAFAEAQFEVEGWMGSPTHFSTDWRAGRELAMQLMDDGFEIEGVPA
jgi:hypothetical protein